MEDASNRMDNWIVLMWQKNGLAPVAEVSVQVRCVEPAKPKW